MLTSVTGPLYVSGPMTDIPEFNYPAFRLAKKVLTENGYEAFIPELAVEKYPNLPEREQYRAAMLDDIAYISHVAHGIVVLPGFAVSPGAACELSVALSLNLPVYGYVGPMPNDGRTDWLAEPLVELRAFRRLRYTDLDMQEDHHIYCPGNAEWDKRDEEFTRAHRALVAKR